MTYRLTESDTAHADVSRFTLENLQTVESYVRSLAANPRHAFRIERRREGVADVVVLHATDRTISLFILPPDDICRERLAADAMPRGYEMLDGAIQPRHATGQHCDCDECTAPTLAEGQTCQCGNYDHSSGFEPCNVYGEDMEPTPDWPGLYRCNRCGLIYRNAPIVAVAPPNAAPAPQCADCTVDLRPSNQSVIDRSRCFPCAELHRRAS